MKYGITLTHMLGPSSSAQEVIRFACEAEKAGFHSISVSDHIVLSEFDPAAYPAGTFPPDVHWYDPFVVLAAIAGATTTIRLATGVVVVPYRPPIQQAQAVATLDHMSRGRFFFGVGLGWMREEFAALGVPFSERGRRADEYLEVMRLLWSGTGGAFHGEFIDFDGGRISPRPLADQHPPILVGGETPAALRRIARYGDGFCINWKRLPEFGDLLDALAPSMDAADREVRDLYMQLACTDADLVRAEKADLPKYEELGLDEIVFMPSAGSFPEGLALMHEIADEFIE